jgi:outer membrane protein assembly factor BamB
MFGGKNLVFGAACSPLAEGGKVFVNVGAPGASVVAFTDTGEVAWKALDDPASYSSPIAFGEGKDRQIVFLTGAGLASLRVADGTLFWKFPLKDKLMESSTTPVRAGRRLLASSITYGSVALNLLSADGKPEAKEAWKNPELTSYFTTPVVVGTDDLYMVTGSNPLSFQPKATLHAIDLKTGKKRWSKPGVGEYHAALLRTGDDKILMMEEGGTLVLLQADPKAYRELARAKVCGHAWAHPAIAGGRLYVRDEKELLCVQLPQ